MVFVCSSRFGHLLWVIQCTNIQLCTHILMESFSKMRPEYGISFRHQRYRHTMSGHHFLHIDVCKLINISNLFDGNEVSTLLFDGRLLPK